MAGFSIFIALLFITPAINAQDVPALLKEAVRQEAIPNESAAYETYKKIFTLQPSHVVALSRASQLASRIGSRQTDSKSRDSWFQLAGDYAQKALKINAAHDEANVSMAMYLGKSSLTKSGKEKIKSVNKIKSHLDVAIKTNSTNYLAWHILGRLNFEISNVSGLEKAAAKIFYDALPKGSLANAIMYLDKARTLQPNFILNNYELARAYEKNGEKSKAINILNKIPAMPIGTEDDYALKIKAKDLLKDLQD